MVLKPCIERLELSGYKSISRAVIEFIDLNVLIGSSGAGKSNLASFFSLLIATYAQKQTEYIERHGGPNSLLYLGAGQTKEINAVITIRTVAGTDALELKLAFRAPDSLSGGVHRVGPLSPHISGNLSTWISLGERIASYHLVDTGVTARMRTEVYVEDNRRLHSDGGNLAAMLYLYKIRSPHAYHRIRSTVCKVVPSFDDFALEPKRLNSNNILLNWRQRGSDYLLGPHQISDGSLRAMALIALLLQPKEDLPDLLIVDEPELGLHPGRLRHDG